MSSIFEHYSVGYHSCDRQIGERVLSGLEQLKPSQNRYDWLGSGVYFWESNIERAFEYAYLLSKRMRHPAIKEPFVIGAIFHFGNCLDLLQSENLKILKQGYESFRAYAVLTGRTNLPENRPLRDGGDLLFRDLDCAVINYVHDQNARDGLPSYDTVRGVFWEGDELYPNAGFKSHNHIQICVRNLDCIVGYFRPLKRKSA